MPVPTCSKCGNSDFEVLEYKPLNLDYKLVFVQCRSCGAAVGAIDLYNVASMLYELDHKLNKRLDEIDAKVENIGYKLNWLSK